MSKIKLGINGFGRIGRMVFRASLKRNDVQVVGINDLLDVEHLAYLLKYDSVHGTCDASIEVKDGNLVVDNNIIKISAERDPKQIGWDGIDTDVSITQVPWLASLGGFKTRTKWDHQCGGSLVTNKHVLTAAHWWVSSTSSGFPFVYPFYSRITTLAESTC